MIAGSGTPSRRRVLLVNLDFRDFVYSYLWGRAILAGCARRRMPVDMVAVNPFVGRDLAAELGTPRSQLTPQLEGTLTYLEQPNEARARAAIGRLLECHRYDTVILNCEAALFMHLMLERAEKLSETRWLVYDRHLHVDLRAHDRNTELRDRIIASKLQLFTIQEIAAGGPTAAMGAETDYVRSLKRLGLTAEQIHFQPWPMDDAYFAPQASPSPTNESVIFTGGDSGRDYATLFEAIRDLPVHLRLCAGRFPTPVPPNVTILPRLPLHHFRDEIARATLVVIPLSGEPPVSGITVIALAEMLGKPVIASDTAVVRMHIPSHGNGGYLTPIGDADALRELVARLIAAPDERERLGREARAQGVRNLDLGTFAERFLACGERATAQSDADASAPSSGTSPRPDGAALRLAGRCDSEVRVETLPADAPDLIGWIRERVDVLCADGLRGPLYFFTRVPPDAVLAEALRLVVADRRVDPALVAEGTLSRAHVDLLRHSGIRALYVTLYGATPRLHDARAHQQDSFRRALAMLVSVPRVLERVRVGVHFVLSAGSSDEIPGILQILKRIAGAELLLWDAASCGVDDVVAPDASRALLALDGALTTAQKLGVRVRPVGFGRTRDASVDADRPPCLLSAEVNELLHDGIPLPSASHGVLASDGKKPTIAEAAPTGAAVRQLGLELAAAGTPLLDLPACLGGPPPEARASSGGVKVDACRRCPIDRRCAGVPESVMAIPGLRDEVQPPRHWLAKSAGIRVAVACGPVYDTIYGAPFFGVARWLARLGAHVDIITPWKIHRDIPPAFSEVQEMGRPEGADELERFIVDGPIDEYDLIVTPDPKITHPLAVKRRLPPQTCLAITDFHMLGGMDEWVRDLCPPGRRAEEGGWWPSEQIFLYSAFPGYSWLYTRYGVPMRQVAWQPYALDTTSFPDAQPVERGTSIISGGNHRRDLATLLAAAAQLSPKVHPIDLFASVPVPYVPPQIRFGGVVETSTFCELAGRSRFMIVPLLPDAHHAAGVTAMVTAIMCGRPIVGTDSAAARDYIVHGVNGLLVPPSDPPALAAAIERLDTDPALLATLAEGARAAAAKHTTEAWAHALLDGSRTYEADHWMWTKWNRRPALPPRDA